MKKTVSPSILMGLAVIGVWVTAGVGCRTGGEARDLMMEEATKHPIERPVAMRGEGSFLAGKVAAVATVRRGFDRVGSKGDTGPVKGGGPRQKTDEGDNSFAMVYFGGVSDEDEKEAMAEYVRQVQAIRAAGSPMPPVTLRVQFENLGTEPIEIRVTDVNSELGNFAVRPEKLTLAPGEKGVLDPMISQLGVTSDEIPLKLAIRAGGKVEYQTVMVKSVIGAAAQKEFEALQKKK